MAVRAEALSGGIQGGAVASAEAEARGLKQVSVKTLYGHRLFSWKPTAFVFATDASFCKRKVYLCLVVDGCKIQSRFYFILCLSLSVSVSLLCE